MNEERLYQLALHLISGIGPKTAKQLMSYCGSAKDIFSAKKSHLLKIPGIGSVNAEAILKNKASFSKAEEEIKKLEKLNSRILFYTDDDFPQTLKENFDSPILLYYKGNCNLYQQKIVSIVGTRNATDYGKEVTEKIVAGLVSDNILIVSGLAYGIDIQAHKSALKHNLPTVGVMASGIDKLYPSQHKNIADLMLENGGLLTEEPIGSIPTPPKFPARNRIIAGMSDCTIVVEAAIKGGALITARIANSYNKEVFSVPGMVNSKYSEGTNFLIKNHEAHMISSSEDILKMMNWEKSELVQKKVKIDLSKFSPKEALIVEQLQKVKESGIDELSWNTQIPMNEMASNLITLEFQGVLKAMPGKKYKLLT